MAQDRLLCRRSRPSKHWSRPRFADFDDRNRTTMREPERETAGRPPRPARTALLRRQDLFLGTGFGDSSWRHAAWSMKANSAPGPTARSWRPPNSELAAESCAAAALARTTVVPPLPHVALTPTGSVCPLIMISPSLRIRLPALACDMSVASREKAVFSQWEV